MSADKADTSAPPATKRKRSDLDDAQDESILRSEIWFDDDNIVVQAENTQFKFYKGLLATYSPFFKDAFAIPQPQADSDSDTVDGCQIMRLPETAADIRYMLSFILEAKTSKQKPSTAEIVASLKLGHKYLIPTLWNDAVDRLRYEFPDQLATYQERREHKSNWSRMRLGKGVPVYLIDAVQSVGLQRILPALCYRAVDKTKIETLVQGFSEVPHTGSPSAQSRLMLLGARAKILAAHVELFRRVYMRGEVEGCIYPEACAQARCDMLNMHLRDLPSQKNTLRPWSKYTVQDPDEGAMCDVCMDQILADVAKQQREIWLALPSYFGLPEWSELKDSTVAAE